MIVSISAATLTTGFLIFFCRIIDVSLGTIRTISTVNGRVKTAFALGLIEVSVWLTVITSVISQVQEHPILGVFYAFGYATGNVLGILLEKHLPLGNVTVQVISSVNGGEIANMIRQLGYGATEFQGQGRNGAVTMLYIVCARTNLKSLLASIAEIDPKAFFSVEPICSVSKSVKPYSMQQVKWPLVKKKL
jgi:uncharacterized protein YebE (UPF0316 family)